MSCEIVVIDNFRREAKPLLKKFPSLKSELESLSDLLLENPRMGVMITENVYKIRIAVKSKGKGKSGGMRVLTYLWQVAVDESIEIEGDLTIFLLSIYDKSDEENISDSD